MQPRLDENDDLPGLVVNDTETGLKLARAGKVPRIWPCFPLSCHTLATDT